MKKVYAGFIVLVIVVSSLFFTACSSLERGIIRIHIRANSNMSYDQEIKLMVRDEVIDFITPLIASCDSSYEVKNVLNDNTNKIEKIANKILKNNDYNYVSRARIDNEYFPSRDYDGVTFPADYYDALIIELGSGKGDNWWCVAYPPLCFVGEDLGSDNIQYKSKLLELINKFFC